LGFQGLIQLFLGDQAAFHEHLTDEFAPGSAHVKSTS
jgi:hypothetical protein